MQADQLGHHQKEQENLHLGSVLLRQLPNLEELVQHLVQQLEVKDHLLLELVARFHPLEVQVRQVEVESQLSLEDQDLQLVPLLEEMHRIQQHLAQLQHQRVTQPLLNHRLEVTGMGWESLMHLEIHHLDKG